LAVPDILVIDDDYTIRLALRKRLEMSGYTVSEAMDGNEGIAAYRKHPSDLVILDIMMPGKDGLEVIQELMLDYPDIKIITISGADSIGMINLLSLTKTLGALRAIPKPIDQEQLLGVIHELLGDRAVSRRE